MSATRNDAVSPEASADDLAGFGYGRPKPHYNKILVEVDAGTPMGEYFRRHWHPIALSKDVADTPVKARLMGENLVVFRDKRGRIGCVEELCAHRQASLYYGRVEEDGIRCAYHGWLYDVKGRCLDQAVEPGGGRSRDKLRQPWYAAKEQYGLIFIYIGPPAKMPLLPRYDVLENLSEDEEIVVALDSLPGSNGALLPTNWLLDQDNIHDMGHAMWLHHLHSGPQFGPAFSFVTKENAAEVQASYKYIETPRGIISEADTPLPDGSVVRVRLETQMPLLRIIHPPHIIGNIGGQLNWCVPVDNENHLAITVMRLTKGSPVMGNPMADWDRSDPAKVRAQPSDYEMQVSSGPIPMESLEHLASADRGVVKLRRQYLRELEKMGQGEPLMNVVYDPGQEVFEVLAGSVLVKPAPEAPKLVSSDASLTLEARWQITIKTPIGDQRAELQLHIAGGKVTGSVVNDLESAEVQQGVADGAILAWVIEPKKPLPMKLSFTATLDGDRISGQANSVFGPADFSGSRI